MDSRKNLQFKSYGVKKPICKLVRAHREPFSRSFGTNETQHLREGQLVGRMLLQRLATGATGEIQARAYTGQRGTRTRMRSIYTACLYCVYGRSLALAVQCETTHGVYDFRRGFCTLVLSLSCVCVSMALIC